MDECVGRGAFLIVTTYEAKILIVLTSLHHLDGVTSKLCARGTLKFDVD